MKQAKVNLETRAGRAALKVRADPYFMRIERYFSLGLRVTPVSAFWSVKYKKGKTKDGARLGEMTPTFGYDEALTAAKEWIKNRVRGVRSRTEDGSLVTVGYAVESYLKKIEDKESRRRATNLMRKWLLGGKTCRGVTYKRNSLADVELAHFHAGLLRDWKAELVTPTHSKASANIVFSKVKAALNMAAEDRLAGGNLASAECLLVGEYPNAKRRREVYLDLRQRTALLAGCDSQGIRDLLEGAYLTGARPGELVKMRCSQVDLRFGLATFSGKTGERKVPLSPKAIELFRRLLRSKLPSAYVFTQDNGQFFKWQRLWTDPIRETADRVMAAERAAGRDFPAGVVLYTARHCFITDQLSVRDGLSPLQVAQLVGTSVQMIQKHYGQFVVDTTRQRLAAVAML